MQSTLYIKVKTHEIIIYVKVMQMGIYLKLLFTKSYPTVFSLTAKG